MIIKKKFQHQNRFHLNDYYTINTKNYFSSIVIFHQLAKNSQLATTVCKTTKYMLICYQYIKNLLFTPILQFSAHIIIEETLPNLSKGLVCISIKCCHSGDTFQYSGGLFPYRCQSLTVATPWCKKLNQNNSIRVQNLPSVTWIYPTKHQERQNVYLF